MFDFNDTDFAFTNDKYGNTMGGGYIFDSPLLRDTISTQKGGGSILSAFKDLAVPAGLLYTQKTLQKNNLVKYENSSEVIEEGIYEKLLSMIEPKNQKKHAIKTKRNRENKRKMSRKKIRK